MRGSLRVPGRPSLTLRSRYTALRDPSSGAARHLLPQGEKVTRLRGRMRIIFMGTPEFAVPTLTEIVSSGHEVVATYTRAPKPAGRV